MWLVCLKSHTPQALETTMAVLSPEEQLFWSEQTIDPAVLELISNWIVGIVRLMVRTSFQHTLTQNLVSQLDKRQRSR